MKDRSIPLLISLPPLPNQPHAYRIEGSVYVDRESFLDWHEVRSIRERILYNRLSELQATLDAVRARLDCTSQDIAHDIAAIIDAMKETP